MNTKTKLTLNLSKMWQLFKTVVMRCFFNDSLAWMTSIALITLLLQLLIRYEENDFSLNNMWHVIGWGTWLFILSIYRIFSK
jgi:hypothetical protein